MLCRTLCAACCIAPSIALLPGMPGGKPAGVLCIHLDGKLRCMLFGKPERPAFCSTLAPSAEMCAENREDAMRYLTHLEESTRPD